MSEQPFSQKKIPYSRISLLLSALSLFMFVLVIVFGSRLAVFITCLQHLRYPSESGLIGVVCLTPIYLLALLAIPLGFAEALSGDRRRVLAARIISIVLFCFYIVMSYWLFLVLYWFDAPVAC